MENNISLEFLNVKNYYFNEDLKFSLEVCIKYFNQLIPILNITFHVNINDINNNMIFNQIINIINQNTLLKITYQNNHLHDILQQPTQYI